MNPKDIPAQHELEALFRAQRLAFSAEPLPSAAARRERLGVLADMVRTNAAEIASAIAADFGCRPVDETRTLELFPALEAIRHARAGVARWMRPERRRVSVWFQPGRASVRYQPLGVVGIIVPWNYPLLLAVGPLVAALAAGNRAMLKMSEFTPEFGALFERLIAATFPPDLVCVVNGDVQIASAFGHLPFDHLLFTGSTPIGRVVMAAAAQHLTPVTLELGGKSPAIIAPDFDIDTAARRIVFGKLANSGQTCIAPDYVLLPRGAEASFIAAARTHAERMYGDAASPDYASVAHERHFVRLQALLADARSKGATVEPLLRTGEAGGRTMTPVAVLGATASMRIMQEEIFGPILPILPYDTLDDAIARVNSQDRPLALYIFDDDTHRSELLLDRTASGGVTINDCLLHIAQDDLPFGGVGSSGMGRYHGRDGFLTFSQQRGVFRQRRINTFPLLQPPYGGQLARRILRLMLR